VSLKQAGRQAGSSPVDLGVLLHLSELALGDDVRELGVQHRTLLSRPAQQETQQMHALQGPNHQPAGEVLHK
jgi:hypothetical protein